MEEAHGVRVSVDEKSEDDEMSASGEPRRSRFYVRTTCKRHSSPPIWVHRDVRRDDDDYARPRTTLRSASAVKRT